MKALSIGLAWNWRLIHLLPPSFLPEQQVNSSHLSLTSATFPLWTIKNQIKDSPIKLLKRMFLGELASECLTIACLPPVFTCLSLTFITQWWWCSAAQSCQTLRPHGLQHARLPCPSPSLRVCSNSCPLSWWCHPTTHPLSSPSPPAFNLSQHWGLFQRVGSLHQVAKVLELPFQHQSCRWIFRTDFL